jgi:ABC-type tungstate transport system substrate-binding protein
MMFLQLIDWHPIVLSIRVAVIATIVVTCLGVPLTRLLARGEFYGKDILEAAITLPLVLPPSVVGYGLLVLIGKNGLFGKALSDMGVTLVFTWWAAVLASTVDQSGLIRRATAEQVKTASQITQAAESMRRGAAQTARAMAEQGAAGEQISRAAEELRKNIGGVTKAMAEQATAMQQISTASESMRVQADQASRAVKEQSRTMRQERVLISIR